MENLSKKVPYRNGHYDDVFGGAPRFGVPSLSPRVEDYAEIFGGRGSSRPATSIPVLDLPPVDGAGLPASFRGSTFDYFEVFGRSDGLDFAVTFDELMKGAVAYDSSDEAWTPAQSETLSDESESFACSDKNESISNTELHHSSDGIKQFKVSYNKVFHTREDDTVHGVSHVTQLNDVRGYSFLVREAPPQKMVVTNYLQHDDVSSGLGEEKPLRKTTSCNNKPFVSVSDISLKTQPSHLPPPSRPPPILGSKDGESGTQSSKIKASRSFALGETTVGDDDSPMFYDVQVDASSSAAVSAAAMKDVMEKAQAKLKSAKHMKDRSKQAKICGETSERDFNELRGFADNATNHEIGYEVFQESSSKSEGNVEWKQDEEFFEVVETEDSRKFVDVAAGQRFGVYNLPNYKDKQEKRATQTISQQADVNRKMKSATAVHEKIIVEAVESDGFLNMAKVQKKENVDERRYRDEFGQEENSMRLKDNADQVKYDNRSNEAIERAKVGKDIIESLERDEKEEKEKQKSEKEALERDLEEKRLREAIEKEENEKRLRLALEEKEKKKREAWERAEKEKREQEARKRELEERRLQEAIEKEKDEKRLRLALEEKEKKRREALQREEKEKREKEAREREEKEKKIKEALQREEKEKREKEAREREEKEKKIKEALQREEKEKREKEAREREEKERTEREARERAIEEMRLQKACETEEKVKREKESCDREIEEKRLSGVPEQQEKEKRFNLAFKKEESVDRQSLASERDENIDEKPNSTVQKRENKEKAEEWCELEEDIGEPEVHEREDNEKRSDEDFEHEELDKMWEENNWLDGNIAFCKAANKMDKNNGETKKTKGPIPLQDPTPVEVQVQDLISSCVARDGLQQKKRDIRVGEATESLHMHDTVFDFDNKPLKKTSSFVKPNVVNYERGADPKKVQVGKDKKEENFTSSQEVKGKYPSQNAEQRKGKNLDDVLIGEEKEVEENKRLQKMEEEREREREREKDRMAVDKVSLERAAVERATADSRHRALAEARERLEKANAEAKLRAERAAVERATAEARERALQKATAGKATVEKMKQSSLRSDSYQGVRFTNGSSNAYSSVHGGVEVESPQRCKARLERHQRTAHRAAKALEEKNMRDLLAQRELAERNRLAEGLDAEVKRWSSGKEGNLRALLSTLQYILGPNSGWQPIHLTEVITSAAVKRAYRKATLCVHPDKLQQRGASIHQKYICEKVFDLLKAAWNKFNSEER